MSLSKCILFSTTLITSLTTSQGSSSNLDKNDATKPKKGSLWVSNSGMPLWLMAMAHTSNEQTYLTWTLVLSLLSCVLLILGFSWCCPMRWTLDLLTSLTQKLGRKKKNTFQFHACNQKISLKMDLGIEFQRKEREGKKSLMRVTLFFMLFKSFFLLSSPVVPFRIFPLLLTLCKRFSRPWGF